MRMRKLWLFSLLCVGACALLASWLVAYVVIGGWALQTAGSWSGTGILLTLLLLAAGALVVPYMHATEGLDSGSGPIFTALRVFLGTAALTLVAAGITTALAGPQLYHARFGERTEALIVETEPALSEDGERVGTRYRVASHATEEDLGWLMRGPMERAAEGDRIAVTVDPRGWLGPIAAERLGWTTVPTAVLVCCLAAVALAALGIVAAALLLW
ncbi:hypothetical protein [Streptomyces sp. 6N223]|uniref:hypothetical protein n=1 Tax=Streptomyces sp. 6N223 TaxID=3457412 RepID=UPI003FD29F61